MIEDQKFYNRNWASLFGVTESSSLRAVGLY